MAESIKKQENRGGRRPGAGRPKGRESLSVRQLAEFDRAAKDMAARTGRSLQDIVLEFAYDSNLPPKDRLAAAKLYWDKSVIHATEGGEADKNLGPAVYLPELRPVLKAV